MLTVSATKVQALIVCRSGSSAVGLTNMGPGLADLTYPIATERLHLRRFTAQDVDAVHAYHSLETVARYQMWEPRTREQVAAKIKTWMVGEPQSIVAAVTLKQSGALIGDVVLLHRDSEARQAEIGFSFNPAFAGQGYATEAVRAVLEVGFGPFNLHRIFGRCDARNEPSWRLMQRVGMRREAHFCEHTIFKGDWNEEFYYALLSTEWADLRRGAN